MQQMNEELLIDQIEQAEVQKALVPTVSEGPRKPKRRRDSLENTVVGISPLILSPSTPLPSTNPNSNLPSNALSSSNKIDSVVFSGYEISTWYTSPYPLEDPSFSHGHSQSAGGKSSSINSKKDDSNGKDTTGQRLFVCDGCFKYMLEPSALTTHKKTCPFKHPPGKKVYQRGAHIIWEIDGAEAKLYCQNLCLFGKLFIDHKYVFFDVEGFNFYILTDAVPSFDFVLGFFSKEKISYDEYNLACIVTFPPYQKRGYGTLLIEFSYEISRRSHSILAGTPERPLSDLGLKGYLAFWTGVLVRYFRAIFEAQGEPLPIAFSKSEEKEKFKKSLDGDSAEEGKSHVPKKSSIHRPKTITPGSKALALPSVLPVDFQFPTSLEAISRATNLRSDDVAYTLVESGLANWRKGGEDVEGQQHSVLELSITAELVEEVAKLLGVKRLPMMEFEYVLL